MLEAKVAELEGLLTAEQLSRGVITAGEGSSSLSSPHLEGAILGSVVTEGFSAIEMYNRIAATERELSIERGKRREADLYLVRAAAVCVCVLGLKTFSFTSLVSFSSYCPLLLFIDLTSPFSPPILPSCLPRSSPSSPSHLTSESHSEGHGAQRSSASGPEERS